MSEQVTNLGILRDRETPDKTIIRGLVLVPSSVRTLLLLLYWDLDLAVAC